MADNPLVNVNTAAPGATNLAIASDDIGGVQHPRVKVGHGAEGSYVDASAANPLPVADAAVVAKLPDLVGGRLPVDIAGTVPVSGPVTDAQIRATPVPVSGTVAVSGTVPVSAAALPLPAGAATQVTLASLDGKTPALGQATAAASTPVVLASNQTAIPVTDGGGSLTVDGAVSVSGTVTATGPLTDTQLRATPVPVSAASLPLPTGAATQTTLASVDGKLPALSAGRVPVEVQGTVTATGPLTDTELRAAEVPISLAIHETAFTPGYDGPSALPGRFNVDPEGQLVTRGPVHTDESSFRVNFANASLSIPLGSVTRDGDTFTGGSIGDGLIDLHVGDYVKYDADPESAWCQVETLDGTSATVSGYTGSATSGAASRALVRPITGTGGAITVASGQCTIGAGTTALAVTGVVRTVDYAPLVHRCAFSLSQRIANQTWIAGMEEDAAAPRWFARFSASGTTANQIVCETARNPTTAPTGGEIQSTTVTLPNGKTTAVAAEYRVELLTERVVFFVDGVLVAEHTRSLPAQHDEMTSVAKWVNGTTPATNSNAVVDFLTAKNHNKLEIGVMSDAERLIAAVSPMKEFAFTQAGVITINTDLMVVDCRQLAAINIQCTSMGTTGVVTPQWSNDPAFSTVVGATVTTPAGADATTFNAAGIWSTPVVARYLRLRLTTATTAGTTTLAVNGSSFPVQTRLATQPVSGTVTANLGTGGTGATAIGKAEDAVAASGDTGVAVWGVRRDALTTSSSATGDYNEIAVSRHGSVQVADFRTNARSFRAAGQVTLAASASDFFDIPGNATTTVVVTRIAISGTATAAAQADCLVVKRSTANSGGTRAALAAVPLDATDSAASSVPGIYTANPTTGTLVGAVGRQHVGLLTNSGAGETGHEWNFGDKGKGVVLSGTAQVLALNLNGVTVNGGVVDVEIDWYEF